MEIDRNGQQHLDFSRPNLPGDVVWVEGIPFKNPSHEEDDVPNNPDGKDLRLEAARWIRNHPEIANMFFDFAKQMAARAKKFGIGLIAERVRWQVMYEKGEETYKINNNFRAYIARWIIAKEPALEAHFEFRKVRY